MGRRCAAGLGPVAPSFLLSLKGAEGKIAAVTVIGRFRQPQTLIAMLGVYPLSIRN